MRLILCLTGTLVLSALASGAYADVRACTADEFASADNGYSKPDAQGRTFYHRDTYEIHPHFHIKPIVYNRPVPGWPYSHVSLVLTTRGRVECLDAQHGMSLELMKLTPERRAVLRDMKGWRFDPVLVGGKPVRASIYLGTPERVDFHFHEDMPTAPLSDMSVTLKRTQDWPGQSEYNVTIHGNGVVDYDGSGNFIDVLGHHTWRIAPAAAAALFERLRAEDIWSAAGDWRAMVMDGTTQTLTLTIGNQSHAILDRGGEAFVGMPKTVSEAENDIDAVAMTNDIVKLTPRGLAVLDAESFDYKSSDGANLLARVSIGDHEDTAMALLDRGAPPDGGQAGWPARVNDTHVFFRFAQYHHWSRVIAWLNAHGYATQLDFNQPELHDPNYIGGVPQTPNPNPRKGKMPWGPDVRKWY